MPVCSQCNKTITCGHLDEHPGLCCDCFDLRFAVSPRRIPRGAIRIELPNVVQRRDHTCGAACVLAIAAYYGDRATERGIVELMGFDERGSDPAHLVAAAARLDWSWSEYRPMSDDELRACLDRRRPVVLMLQAWGKRTSYVDHWTDGHWVVAIGYDRRHVYFEDPMIECTRAYLRWDELAERWHDVDGADDVHVERYGVAMWRPRVKQSQYARRARAIE